MENNLGRGLRMKGISKGGDSNVVTYDVCSLA